MTNMESGMAGRMVSTSKPTSHQLLPTKYEESSTMNADVVYLKGAATDCLSDGQATPRSPDDLYASFSCRSGRDYDPALPNSRSMSVSSLRSDSDISPSISPTPATPTTATAFGPFCSLPFTSPTAHGPKRPTSPFYVYSHGSRSQSLDSAISTFDGIIIHDKPMWKTVRSAPLDCRHRCATAALPIRQVPRKIGSIDLTSASNVIDQDEPPHEWMLATCRSPIRNAPQPNHVSSVDVDGANKEEGEDAAQDCPPDLTSPVLPDVSNGICSDQMGREPSRSPLPTPVEMAATDGAAEDRTVSSVEEIAGGGIDSSVGEASQDTSSLATDEVGSVADEASPGACPEDETCSTADEISRTILEQVYDLHLPCADPPVEIREAVQRCLREISELLDEGRRFGMLLPSNECARNPGRSSGFEASFGTPGGLSQNDRKRSSGQAWNDDGDSDEPGDSRDDDASRHGKQSQNQDRSKRPKANLYACPYRKRNPLRFNIRDHPYCCQKGFEDINQVKYVHKHCQQPRTSSSLTT